MDNRPCDDDCSCQHRAHARIALYLAAVLVAAAALIAAAIVISYVSRPESDDQPLPQRKTLPILRPHPPSEQALILASQIRQAITARSETPYSKILEERGMEFATLADRLWSGPWAIVQKDGEIPIANTPNLEFLAKFHRDYGIACVDEGTWQRDPAAVASLALEMKASAFGVYPGDDVGSFKGPMAVIIFGYPRPPDAGPLRPGVEMPPVGHIIYKPDAPATTERRE